MLRVLLLASVALAVKRAPPPGTHTAPTAPAPAPHATNLCFLAFSVTATPYHNDADGVPVTDAQRRAECLGAQNALQAEMVLRHADGQLVYYVCGLEEGDMNRNSHLQITYGINVQCGSAPADKKRIAAAEKKWFKAIVVDAVHCEVRVTFRSVKKGNERFVQGYCLKEENLAHSNVAIIGLNDSEVEEARAHYIAKACAYDQSGGKMNKNPHKKVKKQVAFKAADVFVTAAWFVAQHHLQSLAPSLTLPLTIAYALTTRNYRVDDTFVTGRTGAALDRTRTAAFFELQMLLNMDTTPLSSLVALVDTVLHGMNTSPEPDPVQTMRPANADIVPSTAELIAGYDLAKAKALAKQLSQTHISSAPAVRGEAIVIDFMHFVESRDVALQLQRLGLTTTTLFGGPQATPFQCGDNSAAWVCMLRALGSNFAQLTLDAASSINTAAYVASQRPILGKTPADTSWLTGDDIISLVTTNNPDGAGVNPTWLSGPTPLNYFHTFLAQTVREHAYRGVVKIMVVNTAQDRGVPTSNGAVGGVHWFAVAWRIDGPSSASAAQASP